MSARPHPDRVEPVPGSRLRAADLRDLPALADHQRRRHVRAVHDTWGIAAGLRLMYINRPVVQAGVAYDSHGRLLVLPAAVAMPPPAQLPAARCRVLLRADEAAGEPAATLRFVAADLAVEPGLDVVLGVVVRAAPGQLTWSAEGSRHVASAAPVTLAAGVVAHGTIPASSLFAPSLPGNPSGWTAWVDVDAGFAATPTYTASVSTARPLRRSAVDPAATTSLPAMPGTASVEITEQSPHGFRISVRRPASRPSTLGLTPLTRTPDDIRWIAALAQAPAEVGDPIPPPGPCAGLVSESEHR